VRKAGFLVATRRGNKFTQLQDDQPSERARYGTGYTGDNRIGSSKFSSAPGILWVIETRSGRGALKASVLVYVLDAKVSALESLMNVEIVDG
jgi:hypothetical protein